MLCVFFSLMVGIRGMHLATGPYWHGKVTKAQYPGADIAALYTQTWHKYSSKPIPYIIGPRDLIAHIAIYSSDRPVPYFKGKREHSPWIDDTKVQQEGALMVWYSNTHSDKIKQALKQQYPAGIFLPPQSFRYKTGADIPPLVVQAMVYLPTKKT